MAAFLMRFTQIPIEFVGAWTGNTAGIDADEVEVTTDDDVAEGDVLVAQVAVDAHRDVEAPSDWTEIREDQAGIGTGATGSFTSTLFVKVADADDADGDTYTFSGLDTRKAVAGIVAYRHANEADPISEHDAGSAAVGTTMTAPSVDGAERELLLAFFGQRNANAPDSFTTREDMEERYQVANEADRPTASGNDELLDEDGPTGERESESDTDSTWIGQTVTLNPAF